MSFRYGIRARYARTILSGEGVLSSCSRRRLEVTEEKGEGGEDGVKNLCLEDINSGTLAYVEYRTCIEQSCRFPSRVSYRGYEAKTRGQIFHSEYNKK